MKIQSKKHIYIPDTQVKPDTPIDHLKWIGEFIVEQKPDVIIHGGDHADMESLSTYASRLEAEGQKLMADR